MNKQEFLAMSLLYGLKVYVKYYNHRPDNSELETMIGIVDDRIITDMYEEDMAPLFVSNYGLCLHPLSDLTKEIEHKGEKFVPMNRLLNAEIGDVTFKTIKGRISFMDRIEVHAEDVHIESIHTDHLETQPFFRVAKLIEWHFDVADLISKNEAIDVNTLETNPYK